MLDDLKFVSNRDPNDELGQIERAWRDRSGELAEAAKRWRADVLTKDNLAKQVAEYLAGKSVVVYSSNLEVRNFWYEQIANRAQARVFTSDYSANTETEINAWKSQPVNKIFGVILLKSNEDQGADKRAQDEMERQLSGIWPHPMTIEQQGENQQDWGMFLGELSAGYLGVLHNVRPKKEK